jgi:hypothetical protein
MPAALAISLKEYPAWLKKLPGKPVFVGYPAAYDFMFVYWYLIRLTGESPFSHSALDIKTFAMSLLGTGYRESTKRNMPKRWFDDVPHTWGESRRGPAGNRTPRNPGGPSAAPRFGAPFGASGGCDYLYGAAASETPRLRSTATRW